MLVPGAAGGEGAADGREVGLRVALGVGGEEFRLGAEGFGGLALDGPGDGGPVRARLGGEL